MESNLRKSRLCKCDALVFLALLVGCLAVYAAVIFIPYAFADDHPRLWRVLTHSPDAYIRMAAQGRPLNGILVNWMFRRARNVGALGEVRLVSVIEIAALGWMFYLALLRTSGERLPAALGAGIACAMPAMQVYAAWANSVPIPLACIAAAGAALICGWAIERGFWVLLIVPVILLGISASIYQPATMVFVPIAALDFFQRRRATSRCGAAYAVVLVAGLSAGWCVFEYGVKEYPDAVRPDRSGIAVEPASKLSGFIQHPLLDCLNLFWLRSNPEIAIGVAIVLLAGLWIYFARSPGFLILCAILLPVCSLVTLLSQVDSWSYRTQIGLEWMILALGWIALHGLRRWIPMTPLLVVLACISGVLAAYDVTELIAWPQSLELSLLRIALSEPDARNAKEIVLLQPTIADSPAAFTRYDEFGVPSLSEGWVPRSEINLIRRALGCAAVDVVPVANLVGNYKQAVPPGTVVIDMRQIGAPMRR